MVRSTTRSPGSYICLYTCSVDDKTCPACDRVWCCKMLNLHSSYMNIECINANNLYEIVVFQFNIFASMFKRSSLVENGDYSRQCGRGFTGICSGEHLLFCLEDIN